jgi:hypothetical protein
MSDVVFGRLTDLLPRQAWAHEALSFTPWLAANIDQLSEAVGIPLELTGTEIAVEDFSADILARNPSDGTVVLIENQLEQTDHTHLGQIMTYLAGLNAQTVIWIAPIFREPHLSAIRWLNEHTDDGFSFFAVRVRVVRIGDSPYAPIFEVVEKPSDWERELKEAAKPSNDADSAVRTAFWDYYAGRAPDIADVRPKTGWQYLLPLVGGQGIVLCVYISTRTCGIYLRAPSPSDAPALAALLSPFAGELEAEIGVGFGGVKNHFFTKLRSHGFGDEESWPGLVDWFEEQRRVYTAAIRRRFGGPSIGQ